MSAHTRACLRTRKREAISSAPTTSTTSARSRPLIHNGDSTHHHDQSTTPVSLSAIAVTKTMGNSTPWAAFQTRAAVDCGRLTLMVNTLPAYAA